MSEPRSGDKIGMQGLRLIRFSIVFYYMLDAQYGRADATQNSCLSTRREGLILSF